VNAPRTSQGASAGDDLAMAFGGLLWAFGVELTLFILAPAASWVTLIRFLWPVNTHGHLAAVVVTASYVLMWVCPPVRRALVRVLRRAHWRRRLGGAMRAMDIASMRGRYLPVIGVVSTPAGWTVTVKVPSGACWEDLSKNTERIAPALRVQSVTVRRAREDASTAVLRVHRRDPLHTNEPAPWPGHSAGVWVPVPVGVDEDGNSVDLAIAYNHVLVGGLPGAGKSVALSCLIAAAATDPTVRLHLFDGKLVELAAWRELADTFVGPEPEAAIRALEGLRVLMEARYNDLLTAKVRKVTPDLAVRFGWDVHVVVVDELALYVASGDKQADTRFTGLLRDLVARGRAAGVIVIAATQKPDSTVVPTSLRDLFTLKWALRCATPQASDTILGAGWATQGADAATIDPATPGVGFLLHEGDTPTRLLGFHLADEHIATLVEQAKTAREVMV